MEKTSKGSSIILSQRLLDARTLSVHEALKEKSKIEVIRSLSKGAAYAFEIQNNSIN